MKQSQIYFSSHARESTNNQDSFVTNQYLDHITEQKETNFHLIASFAELKKSCQTILETIHKQDANFNVQKNTQMYNQQYLKSMLRKITLVTQDNQEMLDNQECSIQTIMDQLVKQEELSWKLQKNFMNHRASLRKLAINQNNYFDHIMEELEDQDIRQKTNFKKQLSAAQQVLEGINMQQVRLQNHFSKQDSFYATVTDQLEENKRIDTTLLEKQDIIELQQQQLKKDMEMLGTQQDETSGCIKNVLEKLIQAKESINKLLLSLPPNYPIKQLIVSGETISIKSFVLFKEKMGVAIFSNGTESIYVAVDKIDAIYWT